MAQLASLSSVAGRPRLAVTRSRSGMLVHPRFGVSSTTPVLVLSGPGDPIPTPTISLPRASVIEARASLTMRPTTASAPCSGSVGSETTPTASEPSSATVPTTMFVPPRSIPTTYRTGLLDGGEYRLRAQAAHAAVMAERTLRRAVARARAAGQVVEPEGDVAGADRSEPELRDRRAEYGHDRRSHRGGDMQRRAVVRDQHISAADQGRGLPQREFPTGVDDPSPPFAVLRRPPDCIAQSGVIRAADHDNG